MRFARGRPSPLVVEFASEAAGLDEFAFEAGLFICLFRVSGSGIPGVGVAPFGKGFPATFGSGIPGVGVAPFGGTVEFTAFGSGIPGVEFPDGFIASVVNSGGKLFGSTLAAVLAFVLVVVPDWQAKLNINNKPIVINKIIFIIKKG